MNLTLHENAEQAGTDARRRVYDTALSELASSVSTLTRDLATATAARDTAQLQVESEQALRETAEAASRAAAAELAEAKTKTQSYAQALLDLQERLDDDAFELEKTKPTPENTRCRIPRDKLKVVDGDLVVTEHGKVISGLLIRGRILVRAIGVKIVDCIVEYSAVPTVTTHLIDTSHADQRFTTVEHTEVRATVSSRHVNAIGPKSIRAHRCHLEHVIDGASISDSTTWRDAVEITGSLIDNLIFYSPDPSHSDGVSHDDGAQLMGGPVDILIQGSTINGISSTLSTKPGRGAAMSCIMLNTHATRFKSTVRILGNWLDYSGGDLINGRGLTGGHHIIHRNKMGRNKKYEAICVNITGAATYDIPTTGPNVNVWEDTGQPLSKVSEFSLTSNSVTTKYRRWS